jgi:hypothetical protein
MYSTIRWKKETFTRRKSTRRRSAPGRSATFSTEKPSKKEAAAMAASVEKLRELLFSIEPPVQLVDRKSELPILISYVDLANFPTKETLYMFVNRYFEEMVSENMRMDFFKYHFGANVIISQQITQTMHTM